MIDLPLEVCDAFGYNRIISFPIYVKTVRPVYEADWRTDSVQHKPPIPFMERIKIEDAFQNFYGIYFETHYKGRYMTIDPRDVCIENSEE